MYEKYYTPEQLEQIRERGKAGGEARIREVEADWRDLMAQVQAAMDEGADPASQRVQELARRWHGLVQDFTGGDPGIEQSLRNMYQQEPTVGGLDTAAMKPMMEFIAAALKAGGKQERAS